MPEIYIPTRGRIGMDYHSTLREFLEKSDHRPWLVCSPGELEGHQQYHDQVLVCPHSGIGPTRHWILEQAVQSGDDVCIMADDDMWFYERVDGVPGTLRKATDLNPLVEWIRLAVVESGYYHGGMSQRSGNNRQEETYRINTRVNNFHFFNPRTYLEVCRDINFCTLPVMEDFAVTLHLLTRGYANITTFNWCWNQRLASGQRGGCALYRTKELQAEAAHKLHDLFPRYVSVRDKYSASGQGVFAGWRKDVFIQWRKAFEQR